MTRRLRREWWPLQWIAVGLLLLFLIFRVRRISFGLPGTDVRLGLDFEAAYMHIGPRLFLLLIIIAVALLWSRRRRSGGE